MSREIKFRAWDSDAMQMIYPSIGFNEKYVLQLNCEYIGEFNGRTYGSIKVQLMQYTGLKDKNGKEIYEGDIINAYDNAAVEDGGYGKIHIGEIIYTYTCYSLKIHGKQTVNTPALKHWENDVYLDDWINAENIEVIGNIYEHENLLHEK